MKFLLLLLGGLFVWLAVSNASAQFKPDQRNVWYVDSPDHGQTYAYGSEQTRQWVSIPSDHHLAIYTVYTNDPYVDRTTARQYDYFTFGFPTIKLKPGTDTFYYYTKKGRALPVAKYKTGFLWVKSIVLTPNAHLEVQKTRGYLSYRLVVEDHDPFKTIPANWRQVE